jgi:hypothetical protein
MTAIQQKMPLGEQLVHAGLLMEVQLELAKREQLRNGGRLGPILVQLGFSARKPWPSSSPARPAPKPSISTAFPSIKASLPSSLRRSPRT